MIINERFKLDGKLTVYTNVNISGLNVKVITDESKQRVDEKYHALVNAIKKISMRCPNAFIELPVIDIYFGINTGAEACWSPEHPGGKPYLILGDRTLFMTNKIISGQSALSGMGQRGPRGVADQMYDTKRLSRLYPSRWLSELSGRYVGSKQLEKATSIIIHELGHIIHGCNNISKNTFWENKKIGASLVPYEVSAQVSSYTHANNHNEFVAEVFTGLICGKSYSHEVISLYKEYHGPSIIHLN